jgi:HD-GYP domain-containing protein (c-di-GMP phosphodiesterase class II)
LIEILHHHDHNHSGEILTLLDDNHAEALLVKFGNLTSKEREIMESHAKMTYDILSNIPWPDELGDIPSIAANHHERLDGSGYYKGLKGDDIHCSSKILAVLDVYEALTSSDRPYRSPLSSEKAFEILKQEAYQGKLDIRIIEILESIIEREQ